jgi:HlyD family secretion protein
MTKANEQSTKRKRRRWLSVVIGGVVVAVFVVSVMPKPLPVDIIAVERGDLLVTVDEDGQTRIKDRYLIDAPLDGHVGRIDLHAGDSVEE